MTYRQTVMERIAALHFTMLMMWLAVKQKV